MTESKAALYILFGLGVIIIGLVTKRFNAGYRVNSDRPIPRWQGLTLFLVGGSLFTIYGLINFFKVLLEH